MDDLRSYLSDLRANWNDHYWRASHPEVMAVLVGLITGLLGLLFAWAQLLLERKYHPGANNA